MNSAVSSEFSALLGRVAARVDKFLTSERIARARTAIDEVEEFARD